MHKTTFKKRISIIGGGFFGMYIAEYCALLGHDVVMYEKEDSCMTHASYNNQARVHNGYHYPRSILTALRSRVSFPRFVEEFSHCIDSEFEMYYLVGTHLGKVTGTQFVKFCHRIGAFCDPAPHSINKLLNPRLIDSAFSTVEYAFDAVKLKDIMWERLKTAGVTVHLSTCVESIKKSPNETITLSSKNLKSDEEWSDEFHDVFNCTYSLLNNLISNSKLKLIPLKNELTEMAVVDVPDIFNKVGITVMCGPFFSVMPFPPKGFHTLSHVRYTPHFEWYEGEENPYFNAHDYIVGINPKSKYNYMIKDVSRYIPSLSESTYKESLWEVKTLLPRSETNDSRPILFKPNYVLNGFHCVLGGKIDNVYDAIDIIKEMGL